MNGLRKVIGLLMVTIFAAFSLPAIAHGDDEKFTLVMSPASVPGGAQTITATLATLAGDDDRIKSFKLITPPGVTQLSVTSTSPAISTTNIQIVQATATAAGSVSVKNVNLSRSNRTVVLTLSVTFPPAACVPASYSWSAKAWEESNFNDGQFAGPAAGSQLTTTVAGGACNYSLSGIPATVAEGTTTPTATVTLTNASGSTASITNFKLTAPAVFTVALVSPPTGVTLSGNTITIANAISPGNSVNFGLTLTAPDSCTQTAAADWTLQPTPLSFSLIGTTPSTGIASSGCTLGFDRQPTDAFTGAVITNTPFSSSGPTVRVKLTQNGLPPPATSVSVNSAACSISGTATTDASGYASFAGLTSTSTATVSGCVLTATASATGYTSSSSNAFQIVKPAGTLGCDNTNNYAHGDIGAGTTNYDPATDGPFLGTPGWGLRRGLNATGDCPRQIPYTVTFDGTKAGFVADKLGQSILVEYVLVTTPIATDANGWPPARHSKFAWGLLPHNPPVSGSSEFVDALVCAYDYITDPVGHPPLPTIPAGFSNPGGFAQYQPGQTAQMCAAQQGWTSFAPGLVQFWLRVIDSDGWSEP